MVVHKNNKLKYEKNKLTTSIIEQALIDSSLEYTLSFEFETRCCYIYNSSEKLLAEINIETAQFEEVYIEAGSRDDKHMQKLTNAIQLNEEQSDSVIEYDPQKGWNFE